MSVDPRLNCAAEICCPPEQGNIATVEILCDLGVPEKEAPKLAARMKELGIAFTSTELCEAIRHIAFGG